MANLGKKTQIRDRSGHFTSRVTTSDPPLVAVSVTNPITYLKIWWQKIMSNEGVDFRFRVHPLTAIAIVLAIASGSFGLGLLARSPLGKYLPISPSSTSSSSSTQTTPSTVPWRDAAFTGILRYSSTTKGYYLTTTSSEAIILEVPSNVELQKLIGKRILAIGSYNNDSKILKVKDASTMEILPIQITPIPVNSNIATSSAIPKI